MEDHFMNENEAMNAEALEETPKKRRGGRRPKAEGAATQEKKPPQVYIQYQDTEVEVAALMDRVHAAFRMEKKRTPIKEMKLYVKPEEKAVYYVINEKFDGKVEY